MTDKQKCVDKMAEMVWDMVQVAIDCHHYNEDFEDALCDIEIDKKIAEHLYSNGIRSVDGFEIDHRRILDKKSGQYKQYVAIQPKEDK